MQVADQGSTALQTLQRNVLRGSGDLVAFTSDLLQKVVEATIALVLILVLSIYMLLYGERIGALVRSIMPPGDGSSEDDYPTRVQRAVFGYVRGQLLFSFAMGTGAGVALWIFGAIGIFPDGQTYALFFGAFFGLMELIPYVGPILGAVPPILVALFQDPLTAVWVGILFVGLQQLEGHVVAPLVFGQALRVNPLLVIFALALGAEVAGIIGALLALPIAAIARETVAYLRGHLVLEPWGTPSAEAIASARDGGRDPPTTRTPVAEVGAASDPPTEEPEPEAEPEVEAVRSRRWPPAQKAATRERKGSASIGRGSGNESDVRPPGRAQRQSAARPGRERGARAPGSRATPPSGTATTGSRRYPASSRPATSPAATATRRSA